MRSRHVIAALFCLSLACPAAAETLTNEQIVQLAKAGLSDPVLIAKIRASDGSFDTSTGGLLALRKNGVSNPVIAEMIAAGSGQRGGAVPANSASGARQRVSRDSPDPAVPHPPGIYLLADWASPTRMLAIEPIVSERRKSGNLLAYVVTGGLAARSRKAVIAHAEAAIATPRRRPLFYFFFDDASAEAQGAFRSFDRAASPADFTLVRLETNDGAREAKIGSTSFLTGSRNGVPEKARIPFTHSRIAPGVYAVQPEEELEEGEYGFLSLSFRDGGEGDSAGQRVRVFDFSVHDAAARR